MDIGSKMLPWQVLTWVAGNNSLQWVMECVSWAKHLWSDSSTYALWLLWCLWAGEGDSQICRITKEFACLKNLKVKGIWGPMRKKNSLSSQVACCAWVSLASSVCIPGYLLAFSGPTGKEKTSLGLFYLMVFPMSSPLLVVSEEFPFDTEELCAYLGCILL